MSLKFQPLSVLNVIHETDEAYTIRFEQPDDESFAYYPGQYLTLKVEVGGENLRRAFSLSSCPQEDDFLSVTIKAIPDGRVSHYLRENLLAGDEIEVYPPMGSFYVEPDPKQANHYVLIGAGSGITPLMSILRTVLAAEPHSRVTLLYGNRTERSIIFHDVLEEIMHEHDDRFEVVHVLSKPSPTWHSHTGRLEGGLLKELLVDTLRRDDLPHQFYLCGPQGMMSSAQEILGEMGIPEDRIHREYYTAKLPDLEDPTEGDIEEYELVTQEVKVVLDGIEYEVTVDPDSNILDSVIALDLDPPYACQEGVCSTCRAKLHSGLVSMDCRDGLSDEELEANYILTCQSHPLTDDVKVEFS